MLRTLYSGEMTDPILLYQNFAFWFSWSVVQGENVGNFKSECKNVQVRMLMNTSARRAGSGLNEKYRRKLPFTIRKREIINSCVSLTYV